ncbi:hypothetical protein [Salinactinospora qingdaonensis]|uniref:Uncharacterized protein n=1 Tax=Salinactinospora qingdaonensis TaxID=702744 RepID=A0ABP7FCX9_9ACTN
MSETPSSPSDAHEEPTPPPRHGPVAWLVFIAAIAAVLVLVSGCMAMIYGPIFTGGAAGG